jgi:hypothetical protein
MAQGKLIWHPDISKNAQIAEGIYLITHSPTRQARVLTRGFRLN